MERRMRRKSHVRCGVGENSAITSNSYLSLSDALQIGGQTFNGNILYDKDAQPQAVEGVAEPVAPQQPASPQSVIQNILANARENANQTATPATPAKPAEPAAPAKPNQSAIQSILANARENAGAKKSATESADDKIKNILSGFKRK